MPSALYDTQLAFSQADINSTYSAGVLTPSSQRGSTSSPQLTRTSFSETKHLEGPNRSMTPIESPFQFSQSSQTQVQATSTSRPLARTATPATRPVDISSTRLDSAIPTPPSSSQFPPDPVEQSHLSSDGPPAGMISSILAPSSGPGNAADPVLRSLQETSLLDQLPQDQLERLVADILRDDDFNKLVCYLFTYALLHPILIWGCFSSSGGWTQCGT